MAVGLHFGDRRHRSEGSVLPLRWGPACPVPGGLLIALVVGLGGSIGFSGCRQSEQAVQPGLPAAYQPPQVVSYEPALVEPDVRHADEVTADQLRPDELVLGVVIGNEARAYPLNQLASQKRGVINDYLDDVPIVVTYCGFSFTGNVFERSLDGQPHTFSVARHIWRRSLIVVDAESGTEWCQMIGLGVNGPHRGQRLPSIPSRITDWASWQNAYPNSTVMLLPPMTHFYRRLYVPARPGRFVVGFPIDGDPIRAWRLDQLLYTPVVQETVGGIPLVVAYHGPSGSVALFDRRLGDRQLDFTATPEGMVDRQSGSRWDPISGRAVSGPLEGETLTMLPAITANIRSWLLFFPHADYWAAPLPTFVAGQVIERAAIRAQAECRRLLQEQQLEEREQASRKSTENERNPAESESEGTRGDSPMDD